MQLNLLLLGYETVLDASGPQNKSALTLARFRYVSQIFLQIVTGLD